MKKLHILYQLFYSDDKSNIIEFYSTKKDKGKQWRTHKIAVSQHLWHVWCVMSCHVSVTSLMIVQHHKKAPCHCGGTRQSQEGGGGRTPGRTLSVSTCPLPTIYILAKTPWLALQNEPKTTRNRHAVVRNLGCNPIRMRGRATGRTLLVSTCPLPIIYISAKNAIISPSKRAQDNNKDKLQTNCFISWNSGSNEHLSGKQSLAKPIVRVPIDHRSWSTCNVSVYVLFVVPVVS